MSVRSSADDLEIRPLRATDADRADQVAHRAFRDLDARLGLGWPELDEAERARRGRARILHLIGTDPGGAWGAFRGEILAGVALAIRRENLWGLSLLVVDPSSQSGGVGRRLLERALDHAHGCRGGLILSSPDARALRAYATSGFALLPTLHAHGPPDRSRIPAELRVEEAEADLDLVDAVDRRIRGASHRPDIATLMDFGGRFLRVADQQGRGYAVVENGPKLLAATSVDIAQRLLWAALALTAEGESALVTQVDARQQWALRVVLEARLTLRPHLGALLVRGEVGELTPYLPSGAYL